MFLKKIALMVWVRRHIGFSLRAWFIGLLLDINTKVDLLMLGYFMDDFSVGIYAFTLLFVEAMFQLMIVVQNNINPILSKLEVASREGQLWLLIRKTYILFTPLVLLGSVFIVMTFPYIVDLTTGNNAFLQSVNYFIILSVGIVLASGVIPFNMALNQFGFPFLFTLFIAGTVVINCVLNFFFIPLWGANGAAYATSLSYIAQIPLLWYFVRKSSSA